MFALANYEREIRNYATKNGVSVEEAANRFIYNLVVMRPHFEFSDEVDFRRLGQQWNSLVSDVRNQQKAAVIVAATKAARSKATYD